MQIPLILYNHLFLSLSLILHFVNLTAQLFISHDPRINLSSKIQTRAHHHHSPHNPLNHSRGPRQKPASPPTPPARAKSTEPLPAPSTRNNERRTRTERKRKSPPPYACPVRKLIRHSSLDFSLSLKKNDSSRRCLIYLAFSPSPAIFRSTWFFPFSQARARARMCVYTRSSAATELGTRPRLWKSIPRVGKT